MNVWYILATAVSTFALTRIWYTLTSSQCDGELTLEYSALLNQHLKMLQLTRLSMQIIKSEQDYSEQVATHLTDLYASLGVYLKEVGDDDRVVQLAKTLGEAISNSKPLERDVIEGLHKEYQALFDSCKDYAPHLDKAEM